MPKDNKFRMTNVQMQDSHRAALKLLKKKYKVTKMDDVIGLLLARHEKEAMAKGAQIAILRREMDELADDGEVDE